VLLYDGALRAALAAEDAIARCDIRTRRASLSRAMAIVSELQNILDMEHGGQIAADLDRLYDWITAQFVEATVRQDAGAIDRARRVLEILRDGWKHVAVRTMPEAV
jgi:flagellar protein FliS